MERKLLFDEKGLKAFAEHLKKKRKEKGFTQEVLAHESGLALSQIARIETAKRSTSLSTVFAIARALKIPIKELFDFDLPE